jgi:hypothetical protein
MRTSFQKIGLCGSNYKEIPNRTTEADFDSPQNKKEFFQLGLSVRSVGVGKLFVWDPAIQTGSIHLQSLYKLAVFKCQYSSISIKNSVHHQFFEAVEQTRRLRLNLVSGHVDKNKFF